MKEHLSFLAALLALPFALAAADKNIGVGAKPIAGAEVIIDGSREMLDAKWIYWEGPGFKSSMPIKWKIVPDPVDGGTCLMTDDRAADGGKYGAADIVTQKGLSRFPTPHRISHPEEGRQQRRVFAEPLRNPGARRRQRRARHGGSHQRSCRAVDAYNGTGKWNAYDIIFRAARFKDGKRAEKAMVTMYFNGTKVHSNQTINQVWGGPNSGMDGGNDGGKGITDTPGGLKLQCEGHDVRYRNAWIKELDLLEANTEF